MPRRLTVLWRMAILGSMVLLLGCQSPGPGLLDAGEPYLGLLAPADLRHSVAALQRVRGQWDGRSVEMLVQLEVEPQRMSVVGSTPTGTTLFSWWWHGSELGSQVSPLLALPLPPEYVIADLQLCFWPVEVVQQALAGSDYTLQAEPRRRRLYAAGQLLIDVRYSQDDPWQAIVELDNVRWGYRYRIDTLLREALP